MALGLRLADRSWRTFPGARVARRTETRPHGAHRPPTAYTAYTASIRKVPRMVVATPSPRRAGTPTRLQPGRAPRPGDGAGTQPSPMDTEAWARKRIREHVRDGVAVAAFSFLASSAVASLAFLALRLAG